MAEKLTPQQEAAVSNRGGKLLVSAAAGSGKTKVLVDRLMGYLTDPLRPANIDEFLIITYTKAAASELRGKIASKLSELIAQEPENRHLQQQLQRLYMTNISTVHSFCGDILKQYAYRLDLSADFRVADENECRELQELAITQVLEQAYDTAGEDADFCTLIDTQGIGRDDRHVPEILLQVYSSAQCHLDPKGWLRDCENSADTSLVSDASETVWGKYLMASLFCCLDRQIAAMEKCAKLADAAGDMPKPAQLLWDTVYQLKHLRESVTWDQVVDRKNIDYGSLRFPKKCADQELVEGIKAVRNACKDTLAGMLRNFTDKSQQILADLSASSGAVRAIVKLVEQFTKLYDEWKRRRRILDFGDLEHRTLDLLLGTSRSGPTVIAKEIGGRFREVMVDEYQDSNAVQDAIYSALTQWNHNCFMVGDVKQSIYQFRLADPGIFLEKYASYVPAGAAVPGQGRKVILSSNFRSCGAVLEAVNSVFETCMSPELGGLHYGEEEALHEGIPHGTIGEPEVEFYGLQIQEDTYSEEAAFTAKRIQELLDGTHMVRQGDELRPIRPEDIVILLRSPGSVGEDYRTALENAGIRCTTGGGSNLLKTKEISTLRSLLQTVYNPQVDIPLLATMASPLFGFTADDLAAFRSKHRNRSVYQALKAADTPKAQQFLETLQEMRRDSRMKSLTELLESIYTKTRIDSIFGVMPGGDERQANLQTFYEIAVDFESGGQKDLGRFLEYLELVEDKGLFAGAEPSSSGCVTIMSIHKSKGLEFPVVFLCGLGKAFNTESQRANVLCDKELGIGIRAVDAGKRVRYPTISRLAISQKIASDSLSEELRVLYVAMTRAKDRLIMVFSSRSLEKRLKNTVDRMNMGTHDLLALDASCPGHWVLQAALMRTEAGELFALGGMSNCATVKEYPWLISAADAPEWELSVQQQNVKIDLPGEAMDTIRMGLDFRYGPIAATIAPSKQTATQRKGREKDQEAAENAQEPKIAHRIWRKPAFAGSTLQATDYGTALHKILQFVCLEKCSELSGVEAEVNRLVADGVISQEQADMVNCEKLACFFATPLGEKIRTGDHVLREFKFSILDDGLSYGDGLQGEQILLQGVVDCAVVESDGITIVDFKTDRVTEDTVDVTAKQYFSQVEAYADALSRIFRTRVKCACLYFFQINRFVDVVT